MSEPSRDAKSADAPVLLWFREDLRLADNPALAEAARELEDGADPGGHAGGRAGDACAAFTVAEVDCTEEFKRHGFAFAFPRRSC